MLYFYCLLAFMWFNCPLAFMWLLALFGSSIPDGAGGWFVRSWY